MLNKCKDCEYFKRHSGQCWRNPPVVRPKNSASGVFIYVRPQVERDDGCALFVPKSEIQSMVGQLE